MLKKIILTIISLSLSISAWADELTLNKDAPSSYIVKKGDTLWDISGIFLKQPWLWPKLWRLNPEINNPHLIYPGDELRLVFDEKGQPMLVRGKPELKWSPKVRTQLKDQSPINTIPLEVIAPYIRYDSMFSEKQLNALPYVIGGSEGYKSNVDAFKVYVNANLSVGKSYAIYEKAAEIIDPETGSSLGFQVLLVGTAKAARSGDMANKKPATLYIENVKREVTIGDYVVPVNDGQLLPAYFTMQAVDKSVRGSIIKSSTGLREFGKLQVVMINRGAADSVKQGDVLTVKRKSPSVVETGSGPVYLEDSSRWSKLAAEDNADYNMPEEKLGNIMVFKVYDQVSMALILKTTSTLKPLDIVSAP